MKTCPYGHPMALVNSSFRLVCIKGRVYPVVRCRACHKFDRAMYWYYKERVKTAQRRKRRPAPTFIELEKRYGPRWG